MKHPPSQWLSVEKGIAAYEYGNFPSALQQFLPFAQSGHPVAQYYLGCMYEYGHGVERAYEGAVQWYRPAAEQGHVHAQLKIGQMYKEGNRVSPDYKEAVRWYRLAAGQGDAVAQLILGDFYSEAPWPWGSTRNARYWYRLAAAQGNAAAQNNLGAIEGGPHAILRLQANFKQSKEGQRAEQNANRWYHSAADQGEETAQFNLGIRYMYGMGVIQSDVEAYKWFDLVAAGDRAAAHLRGLLTQRMTPGQVARAQVLARRWKPKPRKASSS